MLDVFLTVILPTFLVAAIGAGLAKWRNLTVGSLSPISLYLLSPALIFDSLIKTTLPASLSLRVVAAAALIMGIMLVVGIVASVVMRHERSLQSAFLLATAIPNAGNLAIPISLFAFGDAGLNIALLIFVTQSSLSWTVGIFIAARGHGRGFTPLIEALKVPSLYVVPVALGIRGLNWTLPAALGKPIELLGDAAIPAMLLVLGFQLIRGLAIAEWRSLSVAMTLRLIVSAALAYPLTVVLGLTGVAQQTTIVVAAMPTAVLTTILATEFDSQPRFVTSAVIGSTLASIVTLTGLITVVQRWVA